jgi:LysR family transcriptional regulator, nitrogen assimilation regulatory protein
MDLRHLKNFVAIVDCGSLSKAAEKVYVAQPALSQQIAGLEGELKTQLLLRSSQGVVPTEAGKVLYRHARTLLRQIEQVRQEVAKPGAGELGPVAIGLPSTMISVLALPLFERVRALHPGIRLHLFEAMSGYLGELLGHGRLDMAIQFRDAETRGIQLQPLLEEDLYVIGQPPSGEAAEECELDGVPIVLGVSAQGIRMLMERSFAQARLELNVVADVDSFRTALAIAGTGAACTVLPLSALVPMRENEHPPVRRLVQPEIRRPVALAWSTSLPRTGAAVAVQSIIVELMQGLVSSRRWPGARLTAD